MGAFDDLVPGNAQSAGAFDDLIPQKGQGPDMSALRQGLSGIPGGQWGPDVAYGGKRAIDAVSQFIAKTLQKVDPTSQTLQKLAANTDATAAQNKASEPAPIAGSSVAQGVLPGLAASLAAPEALGGILGGALAGGVGGALEPVDNPGDNYFTQKLKQFGVGAGAGLAAGGAAAGLGRVLSPQTGAAQKTLIDEGIGMTPGQTLGGIFDKMESKATSIPILGDIIAAARQRGVGDLNKAVYARALAPFGDEGAAVVANTQPGNQGIKDVGNFLSAKYEAALDASAPAPLLPETTAALDKIQSMVPTAKQADFANTIKNLVTDNLTPANTLTPTVAKQVDSKLGSLSRGYMGSQDMDQRIYGQALAEAQSQIKQMFAAANPQTAPLIKAADQGWATLVQLENAGAMLGSKEGVIGPAQLRNAVKRSDTSLRDRQFARGDALNQDLADAAAQVLPSKVPDSGSPGRLMQAMLAGGGGAAGLFAAPVPTLGAAAAGGLAALPYTQMGQKLMLALLAKRPDLLRQAGTSLSTLAAPLGAAAGAASP